MKRRFVSYLLFLAGFAAGICRADTFGTGANSFEIEFVTIGNPGNPADTTGDPNPTGSVLYEYRIGKYEIPEDAVLKANAQSVLDGAPLGLTLDSRGPNKPATSLSWFECAKFVNWLNTSTGSVPAYKFDSSGNFQLWTPADAGYDANNLYRNRLAQYFLPSSDEWYKAAFFDPMTNSYWDFPTASNTPPIAVSSGTALGTAVYDQTFAQGPADIILAGGPSPFGTVAQAGNVWEWEETEVDLVNDNPQGVRTNRGSAWHGNGGTNAIGLSSSFRFGIQLPGNSVGDVGFRVARVLPEPSAWIVILWVGAFVLARRRDKVRQEIIRTTREA